MTRQDIIDENAKRILGSTLPPNWRIRERIPDYRIDYVVEIFENGDPTGLEFAVQLKGTEKPGVVNKTVRFSVETEHLSYWMVSDCRDVGQAQLDKFVSPGIARDTVSGDPARYQRERG